MRQHALALLSGVLGATASCLAKFALGESQILGAFDLEQLLRHRWDLLLVRVLLLVGMVLTNAAMLASFLDGLQESGSVAGTSLATAANFVTSAWYGYLLWEEALHVKGLLLVLGGVAVLSTVRSVEEDAVEEATTVLNENKVRLSIKEKAS